MMLCGKKWKKSLLVVSDNHPNPAHWEFMQNKKRLLLFGNDAKNGAKEIFLEVEKMVFNLYLFVFISIVFQEEVPLDVTCKNKSFHIFSQISLSFSMLFCCLRSTFRRLGVRVGT
jgi:hypothetical protein